MRETDIKYLAGLFDADGSATVRFCKNRAYLALQIAASDAVSPNHTILQWIQERCGGTIQTHAVLSNSTVKVWKMNNRSDLEKLVPRLIKHLVIKGKPLKLKYELWRSLRGRALTDLEVAEGKELNKSYRTYLHNGPVKPKNHPTWAWVAGYIDGDGSLINRKYKDKRWPDSYAHRMAVQVVGHVKDRVALDLLQKAFGGNVYEKRSEPGNMVWYRSLTKGHRSFAKKFLSKYLQHGKLKRHKAEQILANHSQRPTEETPNGEVMAQPV